MQALRLPFYVLSEQRLHAEEAVFVASDGSAARMVVPSSLTAREFYLALGFSVVREHLEGEERTFIMERQLCV